MERSKRKRIDFPKGLNWQGKAKESSGTAASPMKYRYQQRSCEATDISNHDKRDGPVEKANFKADCMCTALQPDGDLLW